VINSIKLFYQNSYGLKSGIIPDDLERPWQGRKMPKVIAKADIEKMLSLTQNLKHRTALTVIYSCGLRRGELISLQLKDIDFERMTVTILNGKGQKDRVLPLGNKLAGLLKKYIPAYKPKTYLIEGANPGEKYSETSLENIFHKNFAKVKENHNFTLHCLRHSYATHLLEAGTSLRYIQELLGHKSSKTTEIYTYVSMTGLKNIRNPIDDFDI
jgi:integrase/recombinase XerD